MMSEIPGEFPAFTSVSVYNHPSGLLSFWYASEWQVEVAGEPQIQVVLLPDPLDPFTRVVFEIKNIVSPLKTRDRKAVFSGVRDGLAHLPGVNVDGLAEMDEKGCWGLEWQCTYLNEDTRCRRRVRLFYSDHYQYSVTIQGSTEERYSYWQGMLEFTLLSVATAPLHLANLEEPNFKPLAD